MILSRYRSSLAVTGKNQNFYSMQKEKLSFETTEVLFSFETSILKNF